MTESGHITIALNDKDILPSNSNNAVHNERGRSRSRQRSNSRNRSRSRSTSRNRTRRDIELANRDATPLIPEDSLPRQKPPVRGPEIDEEEDDRTNVNRGHGVDDGFFGDGDEDEHPDGPRNRINPSSNGNGSRRGSIPTFPYSPDYTPGIITIPGEASPRIIPDINVYQHKKTLAQGMMDLALLSSNANQLRYVLELRDRHSYFLFSLSFIVSSLVLQVVVGIGLIFNSRYNIKNKDDICKADKINNLITIGILLITIINVFVSAFGVAEVKS